MKIDHLQLLTSNLAQQRDFYLHVLKLHTALAADTLSVQAGHSRLTFEQAPVGWQGFYHFAFDIPENRFKEAKAWLSQRVPLIPDNTGADEFPSESWNSDSIYFYDPAGNILEFIARHNQPNASDKPFSERSIISISEIGLATDDVLQTVQFLEREIGIGVYDGPGSDTFTPIGDELGLFIVVKRGRIWFPDTGKPADFYPVVVRVSNEARKFRVSGPPYTVDVV